MTDSPLTSETLSGITEDVKGVIEGFFGPLFPASLRVYNLTGSSMAAFLALMEDPFVMVESTEESARRLWRDILFYRGLICADAGGVCYLPPSYGPEAAGERAEAVYRAVCEGSARFLITSVEAMGEAVWPPEELKEKILRLHVGEDAERGASESRLRELGYGRMPLVTGRGQYSLRGYILDIFPSAAGPPVRVEFFGDEVTGIREFDLESQRSVASVEELFVLPASEPDAGTRPAELMAGRRFFLHTEAPSDGLPEDAVVLSRFAIAGEGVEAGLLPISGHGLLPGERGDIYALPAALEGLCKGRRAVVVASSRGQAERLREIFAESGVICPLIAPESLAGYTGRMGITVGELSQGLFLPGLLILTEREIFGARPEYRPIRKSKAAGLLTTVDDLQAGDYIVQTDRGVGKFLGLMHQQVEGYECDMLTIEYLEGDRLYIPLQAIGKIRKFHAPEGVRPKLDSLRTGRWLKTKEKVRKKIAEMAGRLIRVYAEREVGGGLSFSPDTVTHKEFEDFFSYEETPDQTRAVEEIKGDMESRRPMERLLLGDVGYGKTEVAMRAAFKAVYDGRQVAVLVPTTLLCEQHLRVFRKRFSAFSVTVGGLSRFSTRKERLETLKGLRTGQVDMVIGTHALLGKDVSFSNLGLLVIDEEHRFGVRQKERIKELRRGVDMLSMSATPIPRTLQMSLSGIRGMSVIETPPEERVAVKSTVSVFDEGLIRRAVEREIERGGQVFFIHNRIIDIGRVRRRLERVLPLARIAVAHGRMPERELEEIMLSFLNNEVDVLLSTSIIGSGIDIPTANTIIVNMAERMGLADLYQLRGRVGRSNVRAYAYYLVPGEGAMTGEALKRLEAVQEMSYMGAGARLAMKDLEIRGAGNLLGPEQSGYINAVGFDLYMEMLEQAVAKIKGLDIKEKTPPAINIRLDAFMPEDYVEDMALRLSVYRSISSAMTEEDLRGIEAEMSDRFGRPPEAFMNLLKIKKLSLLAEALSIAEVSRSGKRARFTLTGDSPLTPEVVLGVLGKRVRFLEHGFELPLANGLPREMEAAMEALLSGLRASRPAP